MTKTPPQPHHKVTPHHPETGISTEAVMSAAILVIILLSIGLFMGLANRTDISDEIAPATPVPAPTSENGKAIAAGDIFYTVDALVLSYAAGIDQENEELTLAACTQVMITPQPGTNTIAGVDNTGYWVYVASVEQPGINGWASLAQLTQTRPANCPAN